MRRNTASGRPTRYGVALRVALVLSLLAALFMSGCLPNAPTTLGGRGITVYGFSVMKEALEKSIIPAFAARWK